MYISKKMMLRLLLELKELSLSNWRILQRETLQLTRVNDIILAHVL